MGDIPGLGYLELAGSLKEWRPLAEILGLEARTDHVLRSVDRFRGDGPAALGTPSEVCGAQQGFFDLVRAGPPMTIQEETLSINRCGHWAQLEHPAEFNRLVDDFVANN